MADIDYYADSSQYGQYQYVTLEQVITDYMMSRVDTDPTKNARRYQVAYQAMRGLRELYYDVLQEIKGVEMELSPSLEIVLPPDYVNYVRISWVDSTGQLHPMAEDNTMSIAKEYLQDNNYGILFDQNGCALIGNAPRNPEDPEFDPDADLDSQYGYDYGYYFNQGYRPNKDMSKYFANGKYRVDNQRGIIQFGSDAESKNIVLEYISDGLYDGCDGKEEHEIRVHKFAEAAILDFIYYSLIKNSSLPANEKQRARKEYYNSRRIAKRRINTLRKAEVIQQFKIQSKNIK